MCRFSVEPWVSVVLKHLQDVFFCALASVSRVIQAVCIDTSHGSPNWALKHKREGQTRWTQKSISRLITQSERICCHSEEWQGVGIWLYLAICLWCPPKTIISDVPNTRQPQIRLFNADRAWGIWTWIASWNIKEEKTISAEKICHKNSYIHCISIYVRGILSCAATPRARLSLLQREHSVCVTVPKGQTWSQPSLWAAIDLKHISSALGD